MKKLEALKNVLKERKVSDRGIKRIEMDSRKVSQDDLFVAIRGGNAYAKKVLEERNPSFVIYDDSSIEISDERAILVNDSVEFMQEYAKEYRKLLDTKIIGITGSNGKTTTKDMIFNVLSQKFKGKKTLGNYNNHIGLPYTLLQLEEDDKFIALEMGMSDIGEIELLAEIASPTYGIITNIGDSHIEFLKTRDNVFIAKTELFKFVEPKDRYVFGDDEYLSKIETLKCGFSDINDFQIKDIEYTPEKTEFSIINNEKEERYSLTIPGEHNVINASIAIALGKRFELSYEEIEKGLKESKITSMRFEKKVVDNVTYINDAYNASPISMKYALETFDKVYEGYKKIVVLGDMLELGEMSKTSHEELQDEIEKLNIDEVYLFGNEMKYLADVMKRARHFENKEEIKKLISSEHKRIAVLLKGSRGMKLETLIEGE